MILCVFSSSAFSIDTPIDKISNMPPEVNFPHTKNIAVSHGNHETDGVPAKTNNFLNSNKKSNTLLARFSDTNSMEYNSTLEEKEPSKPSIAFSTVWRMPAIVNTSNRNEESDQYISNLIRRSKNYEFGKIPL